MSSAVLEFMGEYWYGVQATRPCVPDDDLKPEEAVVRLR